MIYCGGIAQPSISQVQDKIMIKDLTVGGCIGLLIGVALIAYLRFVSPPGAPRLDGPGMVVTVVLSIVLITAVAGVFSSLRRKNDEKGEE